MSETHTINLTSSYPAEANALVLLVASSSLVTIGVSYKAHASGSNGRARLKIVPLSAVADGLGGFTYTELGQENVRELGDGGADPGDYPANVYRQTLAIEHETQAASTGTETSRELIWNAADVGCDAVRIYAEESPLGDPTHPGTLYLRHSAV